MPSLLILLPLFGIVILNLPLHRIMPRLAFWLALAIFIVQTGIVVTHQNIWLSGAFEVVDSFFKIGFLVDHLSILMLFCISIVSMTTLFVARSTIRDEKELFKFINLLVIVSIGMSGVVIVKDLFSLYIFIEVTAIASFILIAFQKDIRALEGAFKYMLLSVLATVLMLSSIALLVLISGNTSFTAIAAALKESGRNYLTVFAVGIFVCGLLIKGGMVPFHGWLPDAYTSAPAPVSILLAGIVTKTSGIYTIMRIISSLSGFDGPIKSVLMMVGTVSILVGAFAALGQTDFKRMLSYSSISQVGYIIVGMATGTPLGIAGAAFHLFNHAIFKSLLFVNSAAVESQVGTNDMNRMGGLSYRMPVTGTTSVIGLLSAGGVPPLAGFWSKLLIIIALWQAGNHAYSAIALLAGVLTLAYFLIMQRKVFFGKLSSGLENIKEAGFGLVLPSIILAAITIGAGILFPVIFTNFLMPIKEILIK